MDIISIWLEQTKIAWRYNSALFLAQAEQQYNKWIKPELEKNEQEKNRLIEELESFYKEQSIESQVHILSLLIDITENVSYALELIETVKNSALSLQTKYFLYKQIVRLGFIGKVKKGTSFMTQVYFLLKACVEGFEDALHIALKPIPIEERNKKFILMVTNQFLAYGHGPTKSALGRCVVLQKMGYEVLLLNTAEQLTETGKIPFINTFVANYKEEYTQYEYVMWNGHKIPFCQCDYNMPNVEVLEYLTDVVYKLKPYLIITIGTDSIFASIANNLVPVLGVGMVPSSIPYSVVDYLTLGRPITESDRKYLAETGREEATVIQHKFTSDLKEQTMTVKREDIGLNSNDFVLVVIGGRLKYEIRDDFWHMIDCIMSQEKVKILILGMFENAENVTKKYPDLEGSILDLGSVGDVRAFLEVCDLYVNPIRTGGGTSCVEAMDKGVPVVTTAYGDVAVNAGDSFCTKDYSTMASLILKYKTDKAFYQEKSNEAKKRAEELLDTDTAFKEVVNEFLKRAKIV